MDQGTFLTSVYAICHLLVLRAVPSYMVVFYNIVKLLVNCPYELHNIVDLINSKVVYSNYIQSSGFDHIRSVCPSSNFHLFVQFAGYCERVDVSLARDVYSRACGIHLSKKPSMHLSWAVFEETHGELFVMERMYGEQYLLVVHL